jgi:hypothetical protein
VAEHRPIGWDEAFRLISGRLRSLDDPNRAAISRYAGSDTYQELWL